METNSIDCASCWVFRGGQLGSALCFAGQKFISRRPLKPISTSAMASSPLTETKTFVPYYAGSHRSLRLQEVSYCPTMLKILNIEGHGENTYYGVVSPDGNSVAFPASDGKLPVWDIDERYMSHCLGRGKGYRDLKAVTWSSDSDMIIAGYGGDTIRVWDVEWEKECSEIKIPQDVLGKPMPFPDNRITSLAISTDHKWLAAGMGCGTILVWKTNSENWSTEFHAILKEHYCSVWTLSFSPDGRKLASTSSQNSVVVWSVEDKSKLQYLEHDDSVHCIVWSPDGRTLASGGDDQKVYVWDTNNGALLYTIRHIEDVEALHFSEDGSLLAAAARDGSVFLWNTKTFKLDHWMQLSSSIWSIRIVRDFLYMVVGDTVVRLHLGMPKAQQQQHPEEQSGDKRRRM